MDVTDTPEYAEGAAWAQEEADALREFFSSRELDTSELRTRLFEEAGRRHPAGGGNLENDLRQTAWVAGAFRALTEFMPLDREGLAAVFDAALEMGVIYSSERAKLRWLNELRGKPTGWWRTKIGDATPNDVVNAASAAWWREQGKGKKRSSKWEILVDRFGSREMRALATVTRIDFREDGRYRTYWVLGEGADFQIMADNVWQGSILVQGKGEIVG